MSSFSQHPVPRLVDEIKDLVQEKPLEQRLAHGECLISAGYGHHLPLAGTATGDAPFPPEGGDACLFITRHPRDSGALLVPSTEKVLRIWKP